MYADSDVSVVVVVKNGARFIAEALGSIRLSDIVPAEVLVIDGGSTDGSADIASRTAGVTLVRQSSRGIANAYNEGIALARGPLIAFLSCDDFWTPHKLDRQVAVMRTRPQLMATVGLVRHFLEPGTAIPPGFRPELLDGPVPEIMMETLMARRQAFDIVGPFDPSFGTGEDTDWFARARDGSLQMELIPELLLCKRIHGGNASLTDPALNHNLLTILRRSLARRRADG